MSFQANKITKEHVLNAVKKIEEQNIELIAPTKWYVGINGINYPPKEVMRYAHEQMNGERVWEYPGGNETNKYLEKMGFSIIKKIRTTDSMEGLIEKYKKLIINKGLSDEIYKWKHLGQFKGRPDVNAVNFFDEINGIDYANLIYPIGIGVIHHIAKERSEQYRDCFKILLNENTPLLDRIKQFNEATLNIYRELVPDQRLSHHHDERTMATFLTFFNPDKYTFYKNSFYRSYCKFLGIETKKKGEKYNHYLELINEIIDDYIVEDHELLDIINKQIPSDCFQDTNHKILAQDILFQAFDHQFNEKKSFWRIGTSDGVNSFWEYMKKNNKICIGWSEIGDLDESEVKTKEDIKQLLKDEGFFPADNVNLSKKSREIFEFYNDIKVGDIVLAQDGAKVLGIGIIKDEYSYNGEEGFAHQKDIEWKIENPDIKNSEGLRTTVQKLSDLNIINKIEALLNGSETTNNLCEIKHPLNQILYGPPGTGKTYNTINKSLEIIGENIEGKTRKEIKQLFDKRMKEGFIVFTTFHQSMSYEDFIEGIKPETVNNNVIYDNKNGIFKSLCQVAETPNQVDFNVAYEQLIKDLNEAEMLTLTTPTGKEFSISLNSNDNLTLHIGINKEKQGSLTKENIQKQISGDFVFADWKGYYIGVVNYLEKKYNYNSKSNIKSQNFVLIIDEINRGNVSQIFGEAITLIEEDKRNGNDESLEITLPYSKVKFGVPSNVYIIGTMNTADRSIEALDTALRRRFCFIEMPPKYDLKELQNEIAGYKLHEILKKINDRIETLLDKDHMIGHSYFLIDDKIDELKKSFHNKIIPLLQEYFFGDFGKIGLVLGNCFIKEITNNKANGLFAKFEYDTSVFEDRKIYHIENVLEMTEDQFSDAINTLMK